MSFKTLDDIGDIHGKRVLVREDLNVPMDGARVTDDTRLRAAAPTIAELADKGAIVLILAHFGRPKGERRARHEPCAGDACAARRARPRGDVRRRLPGRGGREDGRAARARRDRDPREYPLPQGRGEERSRAGRGDREARRSLRQRRLLRRAPRARLDRRPRAHAARLCRPLDGGRTQGAGEGAGQSRASGRGRRRRRQGVVQARRADASGDQGRSPHHRRRHGQHLSRRARRRCRQVAVRARPRRHRERDPRRRRQGQLHRPPSLRRGRGEGVQGQLRRRAPSTSTRSPPTR